MTILLCLACLSIGATIGALAVGITAGGCVAELERELNERNEGARGGTH